MTAKHRKAKNNHKHEDNLFKYEVMETEVRPGGNNYTLLLVLFLIIVIGGVTGAWFCFQQHQTLTYLTDNVMGIQMKIVKLQSSHEEMRQSSSKQHVSDNVEARLNALEESYALAKKQVGMALATAEQLKTSDLPAQVLSLHTEMKTRLAEMQQATVSLEQLSQLQTMLKGKSEEFEGVKIKVEDLATLSGELSQKVDILTGNLGEAESNLEEKTGEIATLSAALDRQAAVVLRLKDQLDAYQTELMASIEEIATVREFLEHEQSQWLHPVSVQELNMSTVEAKNETKQLETTVEETAPTAEEEAATGDEEAAATTGDEEAAATTGDEEAEAATGDEEAEAATVEEEVPEETEEKVEAVGTEEETPTTAGEGEVAAPTELEEEAVPTVEENIASTLEEEDLEGGEPGEVFSQNEQEESMVEETAPTQQAEAVEEDEAKQEESAAVSEEEKGDTTQSEVGHTAEEQMSGEESQKGDEEEASEGEKEPVQDESLKASEQDEKGSEKEEERNKSEEHMASEEEEEIWKAVLEAEQPDVEEEVSEVEEEQQDAADEEENLSIEDSQEADEEEESLQFDALLEDKWTMQAFVPRSYLTPARDEEAESQRKAKSRHARQTRRSTQGVTLTDLKEAQKLSSLEDRKKEDRDTLEDRSCLRIGFTDDRRVQTGVTEFTETTDVSVKWNQMDKEGNFETRLEILPELPHLPYCNSFFSVGERWWRDENQNPANDAAELTFSAKHQQRRPCCDAEGSDCAAEHDRLSRFDSTGESATDKPLGRTSSYTRREARLAALNKQEQDSTAKDYKKMYAEALHENAKLKSRLQESKQELTKIRSKLEKVTQRHDTISERSSVLESEKREKQALEKRVSDMEEELKVLTELKSDNQRLKDENGALIRVISKLSK